MFPKKELFEPHIKITYNISPGTIFTYIQNLKSEFPYFICVMLLWPDLRWITTNQTNDMAILAQQIQIFPCLDFTRCLQLSGSCNFWNICSGTGKPGLGQLISACIHLPMLTHSINIHNLYSRVDTSQTQAWCNECHASMADSCPAYWKGLLASDICKFWYASTLALFVIILTLLPTASWASGVGDWDPFVIQPSNVPVSESTAAILTTPPHVIHDPPTAIDNVTRAFEGVFMKWKKMLFKVLSLYCPLHQTLPGQEHK